jgi:hypothetical protein
MNGREEECIQGSGGKAKKNETTMKTRQRWEDEDNIKMALGQTGWSGMHWFHLTQGADQRRALVSTVMTFQVP